MKKYSALPLLLALISSALLLILVFQWLKPGDEVKAFAEETVIGNLEEIYAGKVTPLDRSGKQFIVELKNDKGRYEIIINTETSQVVSISQIEPNADPNSNDFNNPDQPELNQPSILPDSTIVDIVKANETGSIEKITYNETSGLYEVLINETDKKITMSIDAYTGEILKTTEEKTNVTPKLLTGKKAKEIALNYFSGEIEEVEFINKGNSSYYLVEIEGDDREAVLQIHSVSGKILSVSWDDDGDDDDDDDDNDDD